MLFIFLLINQTETTNNNEELTSTNSSEFGKVTNTECHKMEQSAYDLSEKLTLDELEKMIGVNNVRIENRSNKRFSIAILDTGIYPHNDLTKPQNRIIAFKDFVNEKECTYDDNGHGTAIAGIIGGNGFMSNSKYQGLAPFVDFVSIKVLDYECKGIASLVAKGINWAIENKDKYNIKVMNISVGIQHDEKQYDEVAIAAEKAYNEGIFVVASVGNIKSETTKIYSPAHLESVLAVGSTQNTEIREDLQYDVSKSSSYWRTSDGNIKPNLVAPGFHIFSLKSDIFYKGDGYVNNDITYSSCISGTSASAAVVTGVVAILLHEFPSKTLEEIKNVLYDNCVRIENEDYKQGSGFIYLKEEYFK